MDDLISRQALCEYALNQKDKSVTPNDIMRFPSAQQTLCGYNIEHLMKIAVVLREENLPPERVTEGLTDIERIVSIVRNEFEEGLRKAVEQQVTDEVVRGIDTNIENEKDSGVILNAEQKQIPDTTPVCGEGCEYFTDYNGNKGEYTQMSEIKTWKVRYEHKDGRKEKVDVVTEIEKHENTYGNGKYGRLSVEGFSQIYDLRYATGDLHKLMIKSYFGSGLISAE